MNKFTTPAGVIPIIYEDADIIAISKPHGLHCIDDRHKEQMHTLRSILDDRYGKIYIVHRLDAGTGGLMLCAKTPAAHAFLCDQFERNAIKKEYLAITEGNFGAAVSLMLPISSKIAHGKYKLNFKSGKRAITSFLPISCGREASLVSVQPFTGRTHQIRVHLKAHKHPLVADWVYNKPDNDRRLPLFALSLEFTHPRTGNMKLIAPISAYMQNIAAQYRLKLPQ
ncbi:MAG: RluA family pseudouridine synthase [Deferribacteraceae bacterium]|jgi:RluA family pseudouridine synthase|nr:RluA family pseudouridine synthase [Deferribacteraceae bacterium]